MLDWTTWFYFPILTFGILPYMSYYPTTVNLFLFYAAWTTITWTFTAFRVELIGTLIIRMAFYVLPGLLMWGFDVLCSGTSERFKRHGKNGLPSRSVEHWPGWSGLAVPAISIFNILSSVVAQWLIDSFLTYAFKMKSVVIVSTHIPMPWESFWLVLFVFLTRDIFAWVFHRGLLHYNGSMKDGMGIIPCKLSLWHKKWYHSLKATYPLTAHYDHPLSYIFSRFLPTYLPVVFWRMHCLEYFVYLFLVSTEENFVHMGYKWLPSDWFLMTWAENADEHIFSNGAKYFSPWGFGDFLWNMITNRYRASRQGASRQGNGANSRASAARRR